MDRIGIGVIALATLIWRAPWAEARGRAAVVAKYQPKLDRALRRENLAIASMGSLRAAIDAQNAGRLALAKAEAAKLADAQAALVVARRQDATRDAQIDRLDRSAWQTRPGAPCAASDATKDLWK